MNLSIFTIQKLDIYLRTGVGQLLLKECGNDVKKIGTYILFTGMGRGEKKVMSSFGSGFQNFLRVRFLILGRKKSGFTNPSYP